MSIVDISPEIMEQIADQTEDQVYELHRGPGRTDMLFASAEDPLSGESREMG